MCSAISYHVTPKSTHSLIKYIVLSHVLMPLKLQLASILQDFLSKRARGHLKLKVLVQHEPFKKNGKQMIYRLITLKYKSLSRNLLHLSRDVTVSYTYLFLQILHFHANFSLPFSHRREIGCFQEDCPAFFLPSAPVLPLRPSVGQAGQDVLCQENPPRGPP